MLNVHRLSHHDVRDDVVEEHDEFSGLREMLGIASKYIYYEL